MSKFLKSDLVGEMGQLGTATLLDDESGGGGEVTPASIVTATGNMTASQAQQTRENIGAGQAPIVTIVRTVDPFIQPEDGHIYKTTAAAVDSLEIIDPTETGSYSIVFTSGATPTVTVFPSSILGLEDFAAEANTVYEINVFDNRAVVGSWAVSSS